LAPNNSTVERVIALARSAIVPSANAAN